jgi:hypothetical protein
MSVPGWKEPTKGNIERKDMNVHWQIGLLSIGRDKKCAPLWNSLFTECPEPCPFGRRDGGL